MTLEISHVYCGANKKLQSSDEEKVTDTTGMGEASRRESDGEC